MDQRKEVIPNTNIYEVNLRQYTTEGTFSAFALHLPRLKDMGVRMLWLMPVTPISQKHKKGSLGSYYACADYTSVNPEFGNMEDFIALVRQAHQLDIKVIVDWVANHTGWDHTWTQQHPGWYERDEGTGDFKKASGMDDIIELNYQNKSMRAAMIESMKFWISESDIDGFRCDLASWVPLDFWMEAIPLVNKIKPLFWLAESDPIENPDYMQVFDAAYSWIWMHKTEAFYQNKLSSKELLDMLDQYQRAPGSKIWFTSNHDENSWNGSEYEKYGDLAGGLAVFSCTWPGIPLVYSGQELPNRKRLRFFEKDVIAWNGTFQLHNFYKTLLNLHHNHPALQMKSEVFRIPTSSDENIFAYLRKSGKAEVVVLLNLRDYQVQFALQAVWLKGNRKEIFTGTIHDFNRNQNFQLPPWGYLVFAVEA